MQGRGRLSLSQACLTDNPRMGRRIWLPRDSRVPMYASETLEFAGMFRYAIEL